MTMSWVLTPQDDRIGRAIPTKICFTNRLSSLAIWRQEVVNYKGKYHTIPAAGLNPLPIRRSIPIWTGGRADVVLRRTARLANGWFPLGQPSDQMRQAVESLHRYIQEEGRDPASVSIEATVNARDGN